MSGNARGLLNRSGRPATPIASRRLCRCAERGRRRVRILLRVAFVHLIEFNDLSIQRGLKNLSSMIRLPKILSGNVVNSIIRYTYPQITVTRIEYILSVTRALHPRGNLSSRYLIRLPCNVPDSYDTACRYFTNIFRDTHRVPATSKHLTDGVSVALRPSGGILSPEIVMGEETVLYHVLAMLPCNHCQTLIPV